MIHIRKNIIIIFILMLLVMCSDMNFYDDADWSFIAVGDLASGYGIYKKHLRNIKKFRPLPEFMIIHGDVIVTPGNEQAWSRFWRASRIISDLVPFYFVPGNRDVDDEHSEKIYKKNTKMPGNGLYYTFQYNDCFFIILDTEIPGETGGILNQQYTWLVNQLNTAQSDPSVNYIFVSLHRPIYKEDGSKGILTNISQLISLFEQPLVYTKLKMIISGHVHAFCKIRRNGILYLTTGGGGSPLHDKKGKCFHFTKIGIYNTPPRVNIKAIGVFGETIADFDM